MAQTEDQLEKKKQMIIKSAITVFARMGYHNSRVSDISKEAQIAYGLFYHYFPSKDDILITIFQNAWRFYVEGIDAIDKKYEDPLEKLKVFVKFSFENYERNPDLFKVLIFDLSRMDKFYEPENQRLYNRYFDKISKIISNGQSKGVFNKNMNPYMVSCMILGSIDMIIRQYVYNYNSKQTAIKISKVSEQVFKSIINGIV
jgi:TetR/AcrR family transcriptional regulator, fatty acid metabolism regulator protein